MKLHSRYRKVEGAKIAIEDSVLTIAEREGLTPIELVRILLDMAKHETTGILRIERHGTTDKKADEA